MIADLDTNIQANNKNIIHKKIYLFNGKTYDSLEEIPEEFRALFNSSGEISNDKDSIFRRVSLQVSDPHITSNLATVSKYFSIGAVYVLSFTESIAINTLVTGPLNIKPPHILVSLLISIVIGRLAHILSNKEIKSKAQKGDSQLFTGSFSYFNDLLLAQVSAKYSFLLYIPFYIALWIYQNL